MRSEKNATALRPILTRCVLLAGLTGFSAGGAPLTWDGSAGDWDNDARWLPGGAEPTASDSVAIDSGVVVVSQAGETAGLVTIGTGGTLVISAGGALDATGGFNNSAGGSLIHTGGTLAVSGGIFQSNAGGPADVYTIDGVNNPGVVIGTGALGALGGDVTIGQNSAGSLTLEGSGLLTNSNAVIAASAGSTGAVTVQGALSFWSNDGTIAIGGAGSGTLTVTAGQVAAALGITINSTSQFTLAGGSVFVVGGLDNSAGGTFDFDNGILSIDQFIGTLDQDGGQLTTPATATGTTTITGDYNLNAGSLKVEIAGTTPGTEYDRFVVTGFADLKGALSVTLSDGFVPTAGDSFGFLSASGGFNASFSNMTLPDLSSHGLDWQLNPGGLTLFLNVVSTADPADLDGDGDVDDADFGIMFAAFSGPNVPTANPAADLDSDGDVDDADFGLAFAAFTGPGAPTTVPEPASLALLALGAIGIRAGRRRREIQAWRANSL